MTLASEQWLTGEEAVVATADTEAVDLAREALELAKNAVQVMGKNLVIEVQNLGSSSDAETEWLERMSFTGTILGGTHHSTYSETECLKYNFTLDQSMYTDYFSFAYSECQIAEHAENIAVRSGRQTERRARRARATEKATTGVISLKSGLSGRKKCSTLQEVDYLDPLRYLRGTTNVSKLFTAAEEIRLSEGIQVQVNAPGI